MNLSKIITTLAILRLTSAYPIAAASETDAVLEKNSAIAPALREYETNIGKVERDRAKAVIALNEKFLIELAKGKSALLKAEKLEAAVVIDRKIKELTEANVSLKAIATGQKLTTPPAPISVVPAARIVGTGTIKAGIAATVRHAISGNLSQDQKNLLQGWLDGKLILLSPHNGQNQIFYFSEGALCGNNAQGEVTAPIASGELKDGVLTFAYWRLNLVSLDANKAELFWGPNPQKNNPRFVPRDSIDASRLTPYSGPAPVATEEKANPATSTDSDSTLFGRRVRNESSK